MEYLVCIYMIGALMLGTLFSNFLHLLKRLFFGTSITTDRYGFQSWALITGCTSGIGKEMAMELSKRGFNLVLVSRNIDKLRSLALELQRQGT